MTFLLLSAVSVELSEDKGNVCLTSLRDYVIGCGLETFHPQTKTGLLFVNTQH